MKCSFCGRDNDDYLIYCVYCDKPLKISTENIQPDTPEPPVVSSPAPAQNQIEGEPVIDEPAIVEPVPRKSPVQQDADIPPPREETHSHGRMKKYYYMPEQAPEQKVYTEPDEYVDDPEFEDMLNEQYAKNKRRSRMTVLLIVMSVVAVLLFASYFVLSGILERHGSLGNFWRSITGAEPAQTETLPTDNSAISEAIDQNGLPAVVVTVYGTDGEQVTLLPTGETALVQNGEAVFTVDALTLLPDDPNEARESVTQEFTAQVSTLQGTRRDVKIPSVDIPLAFTPLDAYTQDNSVLTADQNTIEIRGHTQPGAHLYIDGNEITDNVSETGDFSYMLSITEYGELDIVIKAYLHGMRASTVTLPISHPEPTIPVGFDSELSKHTTGPEIRIKGYTDPSCTVVTSYETTTPLIYDAETGTFEFTAVLTHYGRSDVDVTVTNEAGESYTAYYSVEYVPDVDSYTRAAQKMDYPRIIANNTNLIGTVFLCEGEVTEVRQEGAQTICKMNTIVGGDTVILYYSGDFTIEQGKSYRAFSDVAGMDLDEQLPVLTARFIYNQ